MLIINWLKFRLSFYTIFLNYKDQQIYIKYTKEYYKIYIIYV